MFTIEYAEGVAEDLVRLSAYRRKAVLDAIENHLEHEPNVEMRRRKKAAWTRSPVGAYGSGLGVTGKRVSCLL